MSTTPETTWETDEVGRWIANTEALYLVCRDADARQVKNIMEGYLSVGPPDGFVVNLDNVDWNQVAADL